MSKIILINGPIGCGKTDAVDHLKQFYPLVDRRCKDKLFALVPEFFCITTERFWELYNNRKLKEVPQDDLLLTHSQYQVLRKWTKAGDVDSMMVPISIRDALIYVSEVVCKPSFGMDYFGVARAKAIQPDELAIDDSCGFAEELPPTIEKLGQENILLIRVHGRGNYKGDSRSYIPDGVIDDTHDIINNRTLEDYLDGMKILVDSFLGA